MSEPWFADVTDSVGLDFVHRAAVAGDYFMPEQMGSGAALFDYDGDGRLDIYLIQNGGPDSGATNRLYHQRPDGRFEDVSKGSGLDITGRGMGAAAGDFDNDGDVDLLVTQYGPDRLFVNNGDGTFTDASDAAGVSNLPWGTSASFFDYDRDGWLDLVIANYVNYDPARPCAEAAGRRDYCNPKSFLGTAARLFHNLGRDAGGRVRFQDVTLASGLAAHPGPGLGVFCADFDGDGWVDIFVANDSFANYLWMNRRDGTFAEEGLLRGVSVNMMGKAEADMGVAVGDVDGDGLFDLFVTHLTIETPTLWSQGPRGLFQDRTMAAGLASPKWRGTGFGTVMADFNHDGAADLAVTNGRVARASSGPTGRLAQGLPAFWHDYAERSQLFVNDGRGRFSDRSPGEPALCGAAAVGRGLACGDIDNDGALDLLVSNVDTRARLYRNVAPNRGHWLMVTAKDPALHRDAYGAEVTVRAGGRTWMRWINPGYSFMCSNDPRAHFGLGSAATYDAIEVRWPDGAGETFPGGDADHFVTIERGKGQPARQRKE